MLGFLKFPIFFSILLIFSVFTNTSLAEDQTEEAKAQEQIESSEKPLYTPFIERYVLDELKQLRVDVSQ